MNAQITATQDTVTRKRAEVAALSAQVDDHRAARDAATARPNLARIASAGQSQPPSLAAVPGAPETRFAARRTGPGTDLLRSASIPTIFISTATNRPLTEEEERRGREFWAHVAATPASADRQEQIRQGWQRLTEQFRHATRRLDRHVLDPAQAERSPAGTTAGHARLATKPCRSLGRHRLSQRCRAPHRLGQSIPETVAVGPDPRSTGPVADDGLPPVDEGMKWITDFEARPNRSGWVYVFPHRRRRRAGGFDRIGPWPQGHGTRRPRQTKLGQLLDAHHYTGGLGPRGTTGAHEQHGGSLCRVSLDQARRRRQHARRVGRFFDQSGSDGDLLTKTLGLPCIRLCPHSAGADGAEQCRASLMQSALLAIWRQSPIAATPQRNRSGPVA